MPDAEQLEERYRANHARLLAARDRLQAATDEGTATEADRTRLATISELLTPVVSTEVGADGKVVEVKRNRQFLSVDPEGQGRAVEVHGDLAGARNVAVLVPGMGNSLETFRGQSDRGDLIRTEAGPGTATVVWLDYDSPRGFPQAISKAPALEGGPRLAGFLTELDEMKLPDANTTLVAHSYGTEVAGQALLAGAHADRVVMTGSPGIAKHVDEAADLVDQPTRLYVERAPGDYVAYTEWHGPDPATFPDAIRMATNDPLANDEAVSVHWHNEYYRPNSEALRNIGRVVRGDLSAITTTATTRAEETKLVLGASWGPGMNAVVGTAAKVYDGVVSLHKPSRESARAAAKDVPAGRSAGTDGAAARTPSRPVAPAHSRRPEGPAR
ncbi:alpha/beta hydrolase family protein [Kribbella amoyensis]|uniref:Alpha/beta hydrolase family protein n=1 Tax=Kribbella amoyensis TaxID=996641 RepID=A0A561BNI5_9ACTN|nr:alpha/beta hydrolase [Kribbella amoyensis]TWD80419.1 alpha/beta hydrolase family protein [Kribbella amoyensis]